MLVKDKSQKAGLLGTKIIVQQSSFIRKKSPTLPFSEGSSYIIVIVDAFTHFLALEPAPNRNVFYSYTTLYEQRIAKLGLPEILVTDNGTQSANNELITLLHLYIFKHKPRIQSNTTH